MPEQRIVITIDEQGAITAKTSGFKGESCIDELEKVLAVDVSVASLKKTDEFHQQLVNQQKNTLDLSRK